ncbi:MAG: MFS transporter [Actinomycetia bacterium]|nr:MFS transporter [Actinomycetes bacterium]
MTRVLRAVRNSDFATTTFASMRVRNFRLFFVGQGLSQIGNWMTLVAQTLLVLHLTDSGVALGVLAAAQFGPVLLLGPWAGLVADRSDKKRLLMLVQSVSMVQSLGLAALVFAGTPPVWAVYALASVGGITIAFDNPARRAFVVEMVDDARVANAVGLNTTMMTASRIVGPAAAGLLVATAGFGWAFLVDGLSYVAVLASLAMIRRSELRPVPQTPKGRGQVREGLRYVRGEPALFVPLVMMAVVGTLAFNFSTVLPLFATRDMGGDDGTYTLLFTVLSVGALVGALIAARRATVTVRTVGWSAVSFGIALFALALAPGMWAAIPVALVVGAASVGFLTSSTAIVQLEAVATMRGRVLALQAMLFLGSTPIGGPVVGWLSEELGARAGILVGAAGTLLAGAWGLAMAARPPAEPTAAEPALLEAGAAT